MTLDKRADPRYLRDSAYAEPSGLMTRVALYDYQQPRVDLIAEVLDLLAPVARLTVADVGCGNGRYVAALRVAGARVIGVDLSPGMLAGVPSAHTDLVAADSQHLPLADDSIDVVMMLHMLYHVPSPAIAIAEAERVVRPGGRLLVATNAAAHLAEMDALWLPLLETAGVRGRVEDLRLVNWRFDADDVRACVRARFGRFEECVFESTVVVTDPTPVVAHAATTTGARSTGRRRDELLDHFRAAIDDRIRREGSFRITTEVVFFLCAVA